ncbi:hypothetical protein [Nocardia sp. NPDC050406]|uniref:TPR repeat region-containing protein n=1 Tax=Nocardia sp. NPDC050406 TaxID=3364318 RepID=UPI003799313F
MTAKDPLEWLRTVDPQVLNRFASTWVWIGDNLEATFTKYRNAVTQVNGAHWEGKAAEAAQARATGDLTTMQTLSDKLDAVATRARQGYSEINEPLQRARNLLLEAESLGWEVGPTLAVTAPSDADQTAVDNLARDLKDYTLAAMTADGAVRDALEAARGSLAVAFASAGALGADQGAGDGKVLADDPAQLSDAALMRLVEAGRLTQEQIDALRAGDTAVIPASQMEYLNQIARSLDGKSPQEILQIMNQLPSSARDGLANSLQLVSTKGVAAGPVQGDDKDLPNGGVGGFSQLPAQMRNSLNRNSDLFAISPNSVASTDDLAQTVALAQIAGASDSALRQGSDLDRSLLQKAGLYMEARDEITKQYPLAQGLDGTSLAAQSIFDAVGDDKIALRDVVTEGEKGERFIGNVLTTDWPDDSVAAKLFAFTDLTDTTVEDPNNKVDVATAERAGNIMSAVGQYMADDERWKTLMNLEGENSESVGERNPRLVQQLATSMSPFIEELAGGDRPNTVGFNIESNPDGTSWVNPDKDNLSYRGARHIFSVMNTNDEAGQIFAREAAILARANEVEFANNIGNQSSVANLITAGRIDGLIDAGLLEEAKDDGKAADQAAKDAYQDKERWFNTGKSVTAIAVKRIPYAGDIMWDLMDGQMDPVKESMIGQSPDPSPEPQLTRRDEVFRIHNVISQADVPLETQRQYPQLFENGSLKSWESIVTGPLGEVNTRKESLVNLLDNLDGTIDSGDRMGEAYEDTAEGLPGRPKK